MELKEIFIDVPWGKMSALVGGDLKGKPVLCVHGILDSAYSFVPLINRLPKGFWYVLVDLPGCGKSDPFPRGNVLDVIQYLIPLKIWVEHFKLTNFTYIGHSVGASLGLFLYLRYPDLIERIVCIDAINVISVEPDKFVRHVEYYYEDFYNPKKYPLYNAITPPPTYTYEQVLELLMKSRGLTRKSAEYAAKRNLVPVGDNLYSLCWDQRLKRLATIPLSSDFQRELMKNVKIPHLKILTFDFKRNILKIANPKLLDVHVESNPDFELVVIDGVHDVHLNDTETVAKHVGPFICGAKQDRQTTLDNKAIFYSKL